MNEELSLETIKKIEFELLIKFADLCDTLNLRYSLGGGTLLGAIRHKGFIPWDDDIDVMMPRKDYDTLVSNVKIHNYDFKFKCYETDVTHMKLFANIMDVNTVIYDEDTGEKSRGISIDVFPLDGLGDTEKNAIKRFNKTMLYRELLNAKTWNHFFLSKTHAWYYEPIRLIMFIMSRFVDGRKLLYKIDKVNRAIDFDNAEYAGCVCGSYRKKEIMKRKTFDQFIDVEFEGRKFKAIKGYDQYLTQHYGNYMELPPKEKQISHHMFHAYSLNDKSGE